MHDAAPIAALRERGAPEATSTLWGLDAAALHDAYWASLGVACVRRGLGVAPQPGADLHLLIEPGQLVWFDLRSIAETLVWSGGEVVRVEIVRRGERSYAELVVADDEGRVSRIERRYRGEEQGSGAVLLARRPREAAIWAESRGREEAFLRFREARMFRVDRARAEGLSVDERTEDPMTRLLPRLVERWARPDRVVEGLEELPQIGAGRSLAAAVDEQDGSGVFAAAVDGRNAVQDRTRVGPLWIGFRAGPASLEAVGPGFLPDEPGSRAGREPLRVRAIEEIFSPVGETPDGRGARAGSIYLPLKRLLDIVGSALALVVAAPVLLVAMAAIALEDGLPVLYAQKRQGMAGRVFRCWKLRTMRRDSERREAELRAQNLCDGPQVLIRDDPRVTRVGRLLRRTQIDEFPQFWNVLVGDMSIVGPRPSPERENQFCPAWREARLSVRPGITGLWQVMRTREPGRDFQEWIRWDMEYVRRMGLWSDLAICVRTAWNLSRQFAGRGAGASTAARVGTGASRLDEGGVQA
ncbi:MAG: hypothetical protein RIS86_1849 [Planctomycetota bacterium]